MSAHARTAWPSTTARRQTRFRLTRALRASVASALAALALAGAAGCAGDPVPVNDEILKAPRYLRYTLRTEPAGLYQEAFRSNYLGFEPDFKAGSKVEFVKYSSVRLELSFNGIPCWMFYRDKPFPTDKEGMRRFVEKHFATTREELNLEALDPSLHQQIDRGVAAIGMTKEQVFLALGYPCFINNFAQADDLPREEIFQASTWIYRYNEIMWIPTWYWYQFDNDGKLVKRVPPQ